MKFKLIQDLMIVLVTCKNEDDPIKMNALEFSQHCSYWKSIEIVSDTQGQAIPEYII